jgi:hypothetical protein
MISLYALLIFLQPSAEPVTSNKEVIYEKETTLDFSGSKVEGDNQLPPAFFVTKMQTPNADSLLQERLKFQMRNYNELGF